MICVTVGAYAIRPYIYTICNKQTVNSTYSYRKTNTAKTTFDVGKTTSDVEKTISDIIQTTSDLFFAPCNAL